MNQQINEQLALLEKELGRLKRVTDYIDDTKQTAQNVIEELEEVQKNYSVYTDKLFNLLKSSNEKIKEEFELQIKETALQIETIGNQIDKTNREKLLETKRLLENYRKTVEATDRLVETLNSVDFPSRLDTIESKLTQYFDTTNNNILIQQKSQKTNRVLLIVIILVVLFGCFGFLALQL